MQYVIGYISRGLKEHVVCQDKKVPRDLVDQLDHVALPASRDHPVTLASTDWMAPRDEEARQEQLVHQECPGHRDPKEFQENL